MKYRQVKVSSGGRGFSMKWVWRGIIAFVIIWGLYLLRNEFKRVDKGDEAKDKK